MTGPITPQTTLDNLKKEAKRWLKELRAGDATARARFANTYSGSPVNPGLRDVQHALALEYGLPGWTALKQALENRPEAVRIGASSPLPIYSIDVKENRIGPLRDLSEKEWEILLDVMKEQRITTLEAKGRMTDKRLERVAELDHVTALLLGGSREISDEGLHHLARMPQLEHLNLSDHPGGKLTDRGLEVLLHLPNLRTFHMTWQNGISDAGVANLKFCDKLEIVDLMGSPTGDGAIETLRGKPHLRRLQTGKLVTDGGLSLLHDFPLFRMAPAGRVSEDEPTHLLIDGPFTNKGLASLAGLDGVFGLDLFWHVTNITADAFEMLARLPNLHFLGCDGKLSNDEAMRHIASAPRLRRLRAQGTVATDDGFMALSRSKTVENFWGRECPNLTGRGFIALSTMPALRVLGVSCKNVDDEALASLTAFPALRDLTSIDVKDGGFRHVGHCERLERLSCMYCRDTTDIATEHIAGLQLKSYYAGLTKITDHSLEILSRMLSLESIEFFETKGITDVGLAHLVRLPKLRELKLSGLPAVTFASAKAFPPHVRVEFNV